MVKWCNCIKIFKLKSSKKNIYNIKEDRDKIVLLLKFFIYKKYYF